MKKYVLVLAFWLGIFPIWAQAQNKSKFKAPNISEILPLLDPASPEALEGVLRGVVLKHLPDPLYYSTPGWGETRMVAHALKWRKRGIFLRPEIHKTPRNHGTWRKITVKAITPENNLVVDIRNVRFPEPGKITFHLYVALDMRAWLDQQNWNSGVRVWAGTVRTRFRATALLQCEAQAKIVPGKKLLPDAVFRYGIHHANLGYQNLVVEHVPGIGGTAASLIGKAAHTTFNKWHPSMERDLLARMTNTVLRAGQTKEARISMSRVFNKAFGLK